MNSKCEHCGELAVDDEDQICKSCGIVAEELKLDTSKPPTYSTDQKYNSKPFVPAFEFSKSKKLRSQVSTPQSFGFNYGIDVLSNLCHLYSIPKHTQNLMEALFSDVYASRYYRHRDDIGAIAACCLLHVLKDSFISLSDLCSKLKCHKKRFFRNQKYLKKFLDKISNDDESQRCDSDLHSFTTTDSSLEDKSNMKLPPSAIALICSLVAKLPEVEKIPLMRKTTELVKVAHACWLFTGRSPQNVVIACTFICWKAMHPGRKNLNFTKFCAELSINAKQQACSARIVEIKRALLKLGSKIPSHTEDYVTEKNILFHLDYILKNFETLYNDLFENVDGKMSPDWQEFVMFRKCRGQTSNLVAVKPDADYDPDKEDAPLDDGEIVSYLQSEEQKVFANKLRKSTE